MNSQSVGDSTPGAIEWPGTQQYHEVCCICDGEVQKWELWASNTITNISEIEIIQTSLQCTTNYYITVVVTGGTSDGLHQTKCKWLLEVRKSYEILITATWFRWWCLCHCTNVPTLIRVRAEVTADNAVSECHGSGHLRVCLCVLTLLELTTDLREALMHADDIYTVDSTTVTSATLPNLQCNTKYTTWVYASSGQIDSTSSPRMVSLTLWWCTQWTVQQQPVPPCTTSSVTQSTLFGLMLEVV